MAGVFDTVLTYQFIRRLVTPFNQFAAYKMHLIDDKGNFLKDRKYFTPQERRTLGTFDIMLINLKKLLAKVPGGGTRLGTIAAAALLLKAKPIKEDSSYEEVEKYIEENFNEIYNKLLKLEDVTAGSGI
jgi:hypothetical protein